MSSSWGGQRNGSGRPKGTGKFSTPTKTVRLPIEIADNVVELFKRRLNDNAALNNVGDIYSIAEGENIILSMLDAQVPCGFPSPADDYVETRLDLMDYLVEHPSATFYAMLTGDSMQDAGIFDGDIALVDKSLTAKDGDIVLVTVDNSITCKRIRNEKGVIWLMPENKDYQPIKLNENQTVDVWGIVVHTIRTHRQKKQLRLL